MVERDVVLMSTATKRSDWPMGVIVRIDLDDEGMAWRALVRLQPTQRGKIRLFERAIHDLVLILDPEEPY